MVTFLVITTMVVAYKHGGVKLNGKNEGKEYVRVKAESLLISHKWFGEASTCTRIQNVTYNTLSFLYVNIQSCRSIAVNVMKF